MHIIKGLICLLFLGQLSAWAQEAVNPPEELQEQAAGPAHVLPLENAAISIRWVGSTYLSPETERVERNYISLESFDDMAGEDVRVDVWGVVEEMLNVWIFVHDRASDTWWAYGGANREGSGIWVVHGVRFGEQVHQGQRYTVRAAVMAGPPPRRMMHAEEWQQMALAISDPVYVSISKRLIRPYPMPEGISEPQIWLSTVSNITVSPSEAVLVDPVAELAGTLLLPDSSHAGTAPWYAYVLIRSATADHWRVVGPAAVNGVKWEIQNVEIADPGEPQWTRYKISAIATRRPLSPGNISYSDWWQARLASSEPVEVTVKPLLPMVERPNPALRIGYIQTVQDTQNVVLGEPVPLDSLQQIIQMGGAVERLAQGAAVYLLINPLGNNYWEVHGPAIVTAAGWRLPVMHSRRLRAFGASTYQLVAIASTSTLTAGLTTYAEWRSQTLAISEAITIREAVTPKQRQNRFALEIASVQNQAADGPLLLPPGNRTSVSGSINQQQGQTQIWVGTRRSDTDVWRFSGPALRDKKSWTVPDVRLADDHEVQTPARYDIIALASGDPLPQAELSGSEIGRYALATSGIVRVDQRPESFLQLSGFGLQASWFIWGVLLFLLLLALEYYFRTASVIMDQLADAADDLSNYLAKQFQDMPRPRVVPSAFGVIILALGIFAIVGYFPIYVHVLETVLNLTRDEAESLALLLIIFIGLAGVIIHLSIDYISDRKSEVFMTRMFDYFLNYILPITVLVVTLALWGVQALLYLEMYIGQVEPGNTRIPAAMGAAAFFIAGIETLGFYWATRLGKNLFGWLVFHLFIIGPPAVLARFFSVLRAFFLAFPNRELIRQRRRAALMEEQQ